MVNDRVWWWLAVGLILIGLVIAGRYGWERQKRVFGRDLVRKSDLGLIEQAANKYYKALGCYPPEAAVRTCGSDGLGWQIKAVPCDPLTNEPYGYYLDVPNCGQVFSLFAKLENTKDEAIDKSGCGEGCGPEGEYNYQLVRWPAWVEEE